MTQWQFNILATYVELKGILPGKPTLHRDAAGNVLGVKYRGKTYDGTQATAWILQEWALYD